MIFHTFDSKLFSFSFFVATASGSLHTGASSMETLASIAELQPKVTVQRMAPIPTTSALQTGTGQILKASSSRPKPQYDPRHWKKSLIAQKQRQVKRKGVEPKKYDQKALTDHLKQLCIEQIQNSDSPWLKNQLAKRTLSISFN